MRGDLLNTVWELSHLGPVATTAPINFRGFRNLLRRATPFSFDDDATALITQLAQHRDRIKLYGNLARMPFPVIWMEYNNEIRHKARDEYFDIKTEMHPEASKKIGWLIESIGETRWRMTVIGGGDNADDLQPIYFPVQYVFDPRGTDDYEPQVTNGVLRPSIYALSKQLQHKVWGFSENPVDEKRLEFVSPTGMNPNMVFLDFDPVAAEELVASIPRPHEARDKLVKMYEMATTENMGEVRYVCAALATINDVPLTRFDIKPKKATFRVAGGIREYRVNSLVRIELPKQRPAPLKQILKIFGDSERRMRRHSVRGHFKRVRLHDGIYVRKWIEPYERGDATLDWVNRSYEITTN